MASKPVASVSLLHQRQFRSTIELQCSISEDQPAHDSLDAMLLMLQLWPGGLYHAGGLIADLGPRKMHDDKLS